MVSPWARADYVSSVVQDHTSITAFIERKWNLPAMTFRDANAHPMTDYFDFGKPAFATPPMLTAAPGLAHGLAQCHAAGLKPPLPIAVSSFRAAAGAGGWLIRRCRRRGRDAGAPAAHQNVPARQGCRW